MGHKSDRPRGLKRQERVREVLAARQPEFTVVLENVLDPHNVMAIIRTCDAVGVYTLHVIESEPAPWKGNLGKYSAAGARKWVDVIRYKSVKECFDKLKAEGFTILGTHLSESSKGLYETNLLGKIAIVLGNERNGISEQCSEYVDQHIFIPQYGMIQSLNVSVACAVCLFEGLRQRREAGLYDQTSFSEEEFGDKYSEWLRR